MTDPAPSPEILLAQASWIRALARRLLRDEGLAEDVAQETLMAGLSAREGRPAWLAGVARNLARRALRSRERLRRRELLARVGDPPPTPHEVLEREDARRAVVEALLRVREPFRGVLLLRYYEDLGPIDIARRLGVPAATVRSRLARGHALLRQALEDGSRQGHGHGYGSRALILLAEPSGPGSALLSLGGSLMTAKSIVLVSAGAAALLATLFLADRGERPADPRVEVARGAAEPSAEGPRGTAAADPGSGREGVAAAEPATHAGRVLDALFGSPVLAVVRPDVGPAVTSHPEDGRFRLHTDSGGASSLSTEALGFETATVDLSEHTGEDLEVRLHPRATASVVVEYSGGAVASGAETRWRAIPRDGGSVRRAAPTVHVTRTDGSGRSTCPLPSRGIVIVECPRSGAEHAEWIEPGEEKRIVLPDSPLTLQLVDAQTHTPLPGLEVEAWFPREADAAVVRMVTDDQGVAPLLVRSFPALVRRAGPRRDFGRLEPLYPVTSFSGDAGSILQIDNARERYVVIGVRMQDDVRIRLVDAIAGAALSCDVVFLVRSTGLPHGERPAPDGHTLNSARFPGRRPVQRAEDGTVVVPASLPIIQEAGVDPHDLVWGRYPGAHLVVMAAGYQPLACEPGAATHDPVTGLPTFELLPAQSRRLRVEYEDGTPHQGRVSIFAPDSNVRLYSSAGSASAEHGPFDWYGGPLRVQVKIDGPWHTVPEAELARLEMPTLLLQGGAGSIEVVGVPEFASSIPLVARHGVGTNGVTYHPEAVEPGRWRFSKLPAGMYLVGPLDWLLAVETQTVSFFDVEGERSKYRARVRPGEVSIVEWDETWASGRKYSGNIRLLGAGSRQPLVFPIYRRPGDARDAVLGSSQHMHFGRSSRRILLDSHGNYEIGPHEPAPELLAVCVPEGSNWYSDHGLRLVEILRPGESVEVSLGAVELTWRGERSDWLGPVQYALAPDDLRIPYSSPYLKFYRRWSGEEPLLIEDVPLGVRELVLYGRRLAVEVRQGELTRLVYEHSNAPPEEPRATVPAPGVWPGR